MPTDEKCYLLRNMKAWYFWNREIGKVDVNQYADAKSLLNALKKTEDIRSNISVAGENSLFLEAGKELGYGMGVRWNSTGDLRVAWVHGGSPAQARGVKRGWQVLSIDGEDVNSMAEINITPQQKGVQKVFAFKDENGATQNLSLASNEYHIQSVLYSNSYPRDGKKVGYIVLKSFVSQNRDEILQGIHSLSSEGIRELVLDLRSCVGGNYILLNQFADYVFPGSADGKTFMNRVYNEDRRDSDTSYVINKTGSISLSRVFVLTTASTANLGEYLLLNLKPYVSVIQIGAKTNGYDAYGISYWNFNSTVQHNLITTIFQNAEGNSCVGGIMPDYRISDGLDRDWGDPDEALLGAALSYIETGQIPQKSLLKAFPNSSGLPEIIEPKHDSY
jgi:C-terminal processing protease CtpA/Prc